MWKSIIPFGCLLVIAIRSISGHAIDQYHGTEGEDDWTEIRPKSLKPESVLMGIAKSLIGGKKGLGSGQNHHCINPDVNKRSTRGFCKLSSLTTLSSPCQFFKMGNGFCDLPEILSLSLNMSNIVLMLVVRGLIWGVSYLQGGGKEARNQDGTAVSGQDSITETDLMLFLGYLVADESGRYDCLNRVACERPDEAENYLTSAGMIWKTAKMIEDVIPLDEKYEKVLTKLQEAIEDGRMINDCQAKYKCFGSTTGPDHLNLP